MTKINITYQRNLRTRCVHQDSGVEILTDAPKDNQGMGMSFSPTDLLATSLGTCTLTLMGIMARSLNLDIKNTEAEVTKTMQTSPTRKIGKLKLVISCPYQFSDEITQKLIRAAEECPVRHSLHPDIELEFVYVWG